MKAVSDTSPLVFLAKLGYLDNLKKIFHRLYIPPAVYNELSAKKNDVQRAVETLREGSFIAVKEAGEHLLRLTTLHTGEMEAIALAKRLDCWIMVDDAKARELANREGLKVIGTVGLLNVMMKRGQIKETPETLFEKLQSYKFQMRKEVFLDILRD